MASLTPAPKAQFFDANGNPLVGGKLYSYSAGTTTPLATYVDQTQTATNTNPVILDSRGEANVWLAVASYKLRLTDANNVEIWTVDNIVTDDVAVLSDLALPGGATLVGYSPGPDSLLGVVPITVAAALDQLSDNETGSSVVGFLQAGVDAVPRTAQSKMRETVSVLDFGADPTGGTDSTQAIQDAIDSGAKSVYLPAGTYAIQGYINLTGKTNVRLYGDGYEVCTLLKPDNAPTYGGRMIYVSGATDILLEGFYIDGNGANQTAYDEDSSIEVWNANSRVTIRNIRIYEALRYGVYLKGDTSNGMPTNTLIENLRTNNSLGTDSSGTVGALGRTGCALISSAQTVIRGCVFQDLFDIESNTATQFNTGRIENCVFYAGADVGANAVGAPNDPPIFTGNVFYANTNRPATVIAYGGLFSGNTFTTYIGGTQVIGNYIGLGLPENNGGNAIVEGNKFYGFVVGIAVGNIQPNGFISGNTIYCPATTTGTVSYDSKTFNYAGISVASASPIRSGAIHNNKVAILSAFNTAGGYAIDSQSTNVRSLSLVGNDCHLSDTHQIAKIYAAVTRSYADRISGNSATVHTSLTGTNSVLRYENNWFTTNFADRITAPSGGTPASGDVALIYNARSSASPTEAYLQWYYTADAGWKKAGAIT